MRIILSILSYISLLVIVAAPIAFMSGTLELPSMKSLLLLATVAWFLVTPFWMGRATPDAQSD